MSPMYQRILVPVDGSATSGFGLQEALRLAALTGGRLRLVHVIDELPSALALDAYAGHAGDRVKELRIDGARILAEAKATAIAAGAKVDAVLHDGFKGTVHEWVIADAEQWHADLIVLGTHGRHGVERLMLGSSAENILRSATIPVLLVRAPAPKTAVQLAAR